MRPGPARAVAIGEAMVEMAPVGDGLYRRGFAGDTFNTIWHMAQLLGDRARCGFVTRIGQDVLSDTFAAELAADGLDGSAILRDPDRTMGLYLIELDGTERSFHYWRGQSAARHLADDCDALDAAIGDAGLIHLSGITLAILSADRRAALLDILDGKRRAGATIVFDPNLRPKLWTSPEETRAAFSRMCALTDIALPSFDDEQAHWGDSSPEATIARLAEAGVGEVAVKNGAGAVHLLAEGKTTAHPTPEAPNILDSSGAGDSFNAGYLAARLMGADPAVSVRAGQSLAAEVIGHYGARAPKERIRRLALP